MTAAAAAPVRFPSRVPLGFGLAVYRALDRVAPAPYVETTLAAEALAQATSTRRTLRATAAGVARSRRSARARRAGARRTALALEYFLAAPESRGAVGSGRAGGARSGRRLRLERCFKSAWRADDPSRRGGRSVLATSGDSQIDAPGARVPASTAQRAWLRASAGDFEAAVHSRRSPSDTPLSEANQADVLGDDARAARLFAQRRRRSIRQAPTRSPVSAWLHWRNGDARTAASLPGARARARSESLMVRALERDRPSEGCARRATDGRHGDGNRRVRSRFGRRVARRRLDVVELREPALDPWRFDRRVLWDQVLLPQRARASRRATCCTAPRERAVACALADRRHRARHCVAARAGARARVRALLFRRVFDAALSTRGRIVVDSDFSRERVSASSGSRIDTARVDVVYPGVAARFLRARAPRRRRPNDSRRRHGRAPEESRGAGSRAAAACRRALVAVGPPTPYAARVRGDRRKPGVAERVELRGYVDARANFSRSTQPAPLSPFRRATKASATLRRRRSARACRASFPIAARCRKSRAATRASSPPRRRTRGSSARALRSQRR